MNKDARDQPLSPIAFTPAAELPTEAESPPVPRLKGWLPAGIAAIVLLWVVVVFLPDWVAEQQTGQSSGAIVNDPRTTPVDGVSQPQSQVQATTNSEGRSPFADAQLAKRRREAQDLLQPLLELQEYLVERGVERWATTAYQNALAQAESGDTAYREQRFADAAADYRSATVALEALAAELPERIDALKQTLLDSLESLRSDAAENALAELRTMAPDDAQLDALDERVAALPAVITALQRAGELATLDIEQAVTAAEQAVAADGEHQKARATLANLRAQRQQSRFQTAMSRGYSALTDQSFAAAEAAFREARQLRPNAPELAAAIEELESAQAAAALRALRDRAQTLEQEEQWAEARDLYQKALQTDPTLVFAQRGLARTEPRATLDAAVTDILEAPERLVDRNALAAAKETLAAMRSLAATGPVYQQRLQALEDTLATAATPVPLTLVSDGFTEITIERVARLGTLTEKSIQLRPGQYTAVGVRNGYVDVRVDFTVVADGDNPPVSVRCEETI